MTKIIGVSGKIGSGKNYLAQQIKTALEEKGYSTAESSFASYLKAELDTIITSARLSLAHGDDYYTSVSSLSEVLDMDIKDVRQLLEIVKEDVELEPTVNAHSRSKSIRVALQILGTEIRRSKNENYWVEAFHAHLPDVDFILVTDVRFPNEADSIKDRGGVVIRLDIPEEIIEARVQSRDGLQYSESVKSHASEVTLDDYERFDMFVGKDFNVESIVNYIEEVK
jgi:thymidylate kinase